MVMKSLFAVVIGLMVVLSNSAVQGVVSDSSYVAAVYSSGPVGTGQQRLRLFPPGSGEKDIPLPFPFSVYEVGPYGRTLYATVGAESVRPLSRPPKRGVFKIEFKPNRVAMIPGTAGLLATGLSISEHEDRMLASGRNSNGDSDACGVFEVMLKDGGIRQILSWDCRGTGEQIHFSSFSSDGLRGLAIRQAQLAVIELLEGRIEYGGQNLSRAAWSPDGKWIAAMESTLEERVIIFDASTLTPTRVLRRSDLVWSPDSRFLLTLRPGCNPSVFTLEKVDIETDHRTTVEGSTCKIDEDVPLWMSSEIMP
jgi:hypothetical protein